jgi:mono/diheme cytochrome c family protein
MQTIRKGSPRNERMVAFEGALSDEDVENVVAYIKTLWDFRALACQGARHMACMGH